MGARKTRIRGVFTPDDLETLCASALAPLKKRAGIYYTPAPVAEKIASDAFDALPALTAETVPGLRIVDPACGCGAFLAAAMRVLYRRFGVLPAPQNICGIELQPLAAETASLRLRWLYLSLTGRPGAPDVVCADALDRTAFSPGSFDVVFGNPPFVPICSIPDRRREALRREYRFAEGRFNLFSLFLELGAGLARQGGVCAWLAPDRLLLNTQCASLRRWLLTEQRLVSAVSLPPGLFGSAVIDSAAVVFRREPMPGDGLVRIDSARVPAAEILAFPGCRIVPGLAGDAAFLRTVRANSVPLGEIADVRDGVIQGAVGRELFVDSPDAAVCPKPLLTGRDVLPMTISGPARWIDYDPPRMAALEQRRRGKRAPGLRLRTPDVFERPKILSRQTADRIVAACDPSGRYYYANTLHGTAPNPGTVSLHFLVVVMNSAVVDRWYRIVASESGKPFPQVKIAILKRLPVCRADRRDQLAVLRSYRSGGQAAANVLIGRLYGLR
ncbi:MAG: N-6 DNA methylase [Lentisphaeria bacterium]|nr:N-6 DNA methylase [Lentisphaeria bacterium]